MKAKAFCYALLLVGLAGMAHAQTADLQSRIYGRITTDDGDVFEGLIRWDKNEVSWVDVLDGSKRSMRQGSRERQIEVLGLRIRYDSDDFRGSSRTSGIRFGHVASLEPAGSETAILFMKNGDEIEFRGGSTDIGSDVREILVEDPERGEIELRWRDIERVDFMQAPRDVESRYGERLFGTLTTRRGDVFEGFICWDVDEVLTEDILDGTDRGGRKRKIRFANIAGIARNNSSSALVTLRNGEDLVLRGSNDVDDDNRGILVLDPDLGQVIVPWDEFEEVSFRPVPYAVTFDAFNGTDPLTGTVYTRDREKFSGVITWDDDEGYGWELLNGDMGDLEFEIEMGMIEQIERISSSAAEVTLFDGRVFELRGSNDVNDDNDGIIILMADGDRVEIDWDDFDRIVFSGR